MENTQVERLLLGLTEIERALKQLPENLFPQMARAGREILSESRVLERLASLEARVSLQASTRIGSGH